MLQQMLASCCRRCSSSVVWRQIRPVKRRVLETGEVVMQGQGKALLAAPEIRKAYLGE